MGGKYSSFEEFKKAKGPQLPSMHPCPWPEDDYRCVEDDWWGAFVQGYMENWNRVQIEFPNKWTPPRFHPIIGPRIFLDFKPVLNTWFKKYYVREWGAPFVIRPGYGSAVLVGVLGGWLVAWNYWKVSRARKQYNVPNPLNLSEDSKEFNCIWRSYQAMCEAYPGFLFVLLIGALEYPYVSSAGGLIWILGRFVYCLGWHSGDPRKRYFGLFYMLGSFIMIWAAMRGGIQRMRLWKFDMPDFFLYKPNNVPITEYSWVEKYYPEFYNLGPWGKPIAK